MDSGLRRNDIVDVARRHPKPGDGQFAACRFAAPNPIPQAG
jgi:hypothetical protein